MYFLIKIIPLIAVIPYALSTDCFATGDGTCQDAEGRCQLSGGYCLVKGQFADGRAICQCLQLTQVEPQGNVVAERLGDDSYGNDGHLAAGGGYGAGQGRRQGYNYSGYNYGVGAIDRRYGVRGLRRRLYYG